MGAHYVLIPDQDASTEAELIRLLRLRGYADLAPGSLSGALAGATAPEEVTHWRVGDLDTRVGDMDAPAKHAVDDERARIQARLAMLTAREDQVLRQVVVGRLNKQIARQM